MVGPTNDFYFLCRGNPGADAGRGGQKEESAGAEGEGEGEGEGRKGQRVLTTSVLKSGSPSNVRIGSTLMYESLWNPPNAKNIVCIRRKLDLCHFGLRRGRAGGLDGPDGVIEDERHFHYQQAVRLLCHLVMKMVVASSIMAAKY
jgi:hypothetical protein